MIDLYKEQNILIIALYIIQISCNNIYEEYKLLLSDQYFNRTASSSDYRLVRSNNGTVHSDYRSLPYRNPNSRPTKRRK